jgi:Fe-S cluster biogenesis protein NfuA
MSTMDLRARVASVLVEQVGPALAMDGTQLEVVDVSDGVARIRLGGVCGSCPSSIMAVVIGIEQELRKHVPEIEFIEAVP